MADKSNHYIDNKQMYAVFVTYLKGVRKAKRLKHKKPPIPEYLGECFLLIAHKLFHRPNFMNYSYKDEMISDAIENCILYIHNFNPKKSDNPFAYFTTVIYYAFLRRIDKEKKQLYVRHKMMEQSAIHDTLYSGTYHDEHMIPAYIDLNNEKMNDLARDFEHKLIEKKKKRNKKKLKK
jgi:hypothetical protein